MTFAFLERHLQSLHRSAPPQELCAALELKEELYQELMKKGQQLLTMAPGGPDSNMEQDLSSLKDKWDALQAKVAERKVRNQRELHTGGGCTVDHSISYVAIATSSKNELIFVGKKPTTCRYCDIFQTNLPLQIRSLSACCRFTLVLFPEFVW